MEEIEVLRRAVEMAVGRKMSVYSDFKWLAQEIYKSTHEQVSYMTLMRVWGYVGSGGVSKGTLNILAHYLGYMCYEEFAARENTGTTDGSKPTDSDTNSTEDGGVTEKTVVTTDKAATMSTQSAPITAGTTAVTAEQMLAGRGTTEKTTATVEPETSAREEASVGPDVAVVTAIPNEPAGNVAQDNHAAAPNTKSHPKRTIVWTLYGVIALLLAIVGWGAYAMMNRLGGNTDDEAFILRKGECFATYQDYLSLFGITEATDHLWSQPLPHHSGIIVFGGKYKHPRWGNLGDSTDLLPTRTEYWHDDSLPPEVGKEVIREHYYVQRESNRLIITFMKDLVDTCFVFCGVYRMSLEQSDTTHVVWERVADRLDLRNLDYLEQLRN